MTYPYAAFWTAEFDEHAAVAAATRDLYRLTSANPGARLVLTLNDTPVGVRPIDQIIADGNLLTFVELPNDQLPPIAERLKRTSAALAKKGR